MNEKETIFIKLRNMKNDPHGVRLRLRSRILRIVESQKKE